MNHKSNLFNTLISLLPKDNRIFIQSHNFPDPDSVASAYALSHLLSLYQLNTNIVYYGIVERTILNKMIKHLNIPIYPVEHYNFEPDDNVIIVDGCKGDLNVKDLPCNNIGMIDHHQHKQIKKLPFVDIRPDYGSTATIIFEYYQQAKVDIPESVATALLIGLIIDTENLIRGVSEADYEAYSSLRKLADIEYVNKNIKNNIQLSDLKFFQEAITSLTIKNTTGFIWFPKGCDRNLLGILGDFFLSLYEIDSIVLGAKNDNLINIAIRSETIKLNAANIASKLLQGIGYGGGHQHMAGGLITDKNIVKTFNAQQLLNMYDKIITRTTAK